MGTESVQGYFETRRKLANSEYLFPDRQGLIDRNPWFDPEGKISSKMLDQLELYSDQSMSPEEIANSIIRSYNNVVTEGGFKKMSFAALYGCLNMYARRITDNERVNRMIEEHILDAPATSWIAVDSP